MPSSARRSVFHHFGTESYSVGRKPKPRKRIQKRPHLGRAYARAYAELLPGRGSLDFAAVQASYRAAVAAERRGEPPTEALRRARSLCQHAERMRSLHVTVSWRRGRYGTTTRSLRLDREKARRQHLLRQLRSEEAAVDKVGFAFAPHSNRSNPQKWKIEQT